MRREKEQKNDNDLTLMFCSFWRKLQFYGNQTGRWGSSNNSRPGTTATATGTWVKRAWQGLNAALEH